MGKEKIEKMPMPEAELKEEKEQVEEIQRIELDPEKGIDIVIKKISDEYFFDWGNRYIPAQVVLEQDGESVEEFQDIVRGFRFYFREREKKKEPWYYTPNGKGKILMPRRWEGPKDVLKLFHEAGHGLYSFKHEDEAKRKSEAEELIENVEFQLYTISERGTVWYQEQEGAVREERSATQREKKQLSKQLKALCQEVVFWKARSERGAWAEGLRLTRRLKQEKGIDLIKPFRGETPKGTRENLEKFVHGLSALGSYEENFRKDIGKLGLDKELRGIFTKHYKEEFNKEEKEISKEVSEEASKI